MEINNESLATDVLITYGGEVKAMGDGRVSGYLVRFSDENTPDTVGDFFTKDTDFGDAKSTVTMYHHGFDKTLGKKKIGTGTLKMDEVGVWIDAQLSMADAYQKAIYKLVEKRKLGWSSGTAAHLVERERKGDASWIKTWPLGLDASLTPSPAEPMNTAMSLKSLEVTELEIESEESGEGSTQQTDQSQSKEGEPMDEQKDEAKTNPMNDILSRVSEEIEVKNNKKKEEERKLQEMEDSIRDLVETAMKSAPADNKGGSAYLNTKTKRGDDPMKAFEYYLRTGDEKAIKTTYYLNEAVDEEGMATVPKDFYNQVVTKLSLQSFPRNIGARSITTSSRAIDIPIQNTQWAAPVSTAESQTSTQTAASVNTVQPFDTLTVTPVKYTRIVLLSDEYLADDKANVTSMITDTLSDQFGVLENSLAVTELTSGVTANFEAAAAAAIAAGDINSLYYKVTQPYRNSRSTAWVMEGATEGLIRGLTGNPFLFNATPQGNVTSSGQDPLMGRPVYNAATVSAVAASAKTIWFGNFNYLAMVTNGGFSVRRLNELYAASGQVAFLFSERIAFKVLQPEAFAYLVQPSA